MTDSNLGSDSPPSGLEATRIDLGEDLLEKTAILTRPPGEGPVVPPPLPKEATEERTSVHFVVPAGSSTEDLLASVKILLGENFTGDAKKILHHILIQDPSNIPAKKYLKELQEAELKQIFSDNAVRKPFGKKSDAPELAVDEADVETLIEELDRDLSLGLFKGPPETSAGELSLFSDSHAMGEFCDRLEATLADAPVPNWIDMGVGFMEMDLHSVAARLFSAASRRVDPFSPEAHDLLLSTTSLLALALILQNRPFEAISKMQPLLRDVEITADRKIELFYLMARIYDVLKNPDLARGYYEQVKEIDPSYRDTGYRLANRRG